MGDPLSKMYKYFERFTLALHQHAPIDALQTHSMIFFSISFIEAPKHSLPLSCKLMGATLTRNAMRSVVPTVLKFGAVRGALQLRNAQCRFAPRNTASQCIPGTVRLASRRFATRVPETRCVAV